MLRTRPAMARSSAGRSPHSRWVIWPTAARTVPYSCCPASVTFTTAPSPSGAPTSWAAASSAIPARRRSRGITMHAHRRLAGALAAAGSRGSHYRVLAALQEFGPASEVALGRRTGMDRSDVVAALNELAGRGLVERSPDPADRRRNVITITADGAAHFERLDPLLSRAQDELLAPFSPPDP